MKNYRCIHIAGTNGKGSVANYIANILMQAGKSVGLFTSPHLLKWQERIKIDGENIGFPDDFEQKLYNNGYFISTSKIAKKYFDENDINYAVIETGIGGRKDITMEFDADVSVITMVAKDHQNILGKKLSDIAYQKAGIIRDSKPVYSYFQKPIVKYTINEQAYLKRTHVQFLKKSSVKRIKISKDQLSFNLNYKENTYKNIILNSISKVQAYNAALAFMICLDEGISQEAIRQGLLTKIKGRCEQINDNLILDVAHNHKSFQSLFDMINQNFSNRKVNIMLALKKDKDFKKIAKMVNKVAHTVYLIDLNNDAFYLPKDISHKFKRPYYLQGSPGHLKNSFNLAYNKTKEINGVLVIAGSFQLTGKIYPFISSE